ncbi:MAG: hypothetical protein QXG98_04330 [Candidatus Micrarchaeia archaeon]
MAELYPPGHQPCQRCGVIVPWEELQMLDGWWMCTYCIMEMRDQKRVRARAEATRSRERCPRCGRMAESLRALSNGELVCALCIEDIHRAKHGELKGIAGRLLGIVDWLLGRKGGKTYE